MNKRALEAAEAPARVTMSHLEMVASDITETVDWYHKVLGTHANFLGDAGAAISYDSEHHRLAIARRDFIPDRADGEPHAAIKQVAYKLDSLQELLSNYLRLKDLGIPPSYCINHTATISFYWKDPNGVEIELFTNCLNSDQSVEFLKGDHIEKSPIGYPFDPDELVKRYRKGEAIEDLLAPTPLDTKLLKVVLEGKGFDLEKAGFLMKDGD